MNYSLRRLGRQASIHITGCQCRGRSTRKEIPSDEVVEVPDGPDGLARLLCYAVVAKLVERGYTIVAARCSRPPTRALVRAHSRRGHWIREHIRDG